MRARAQRAYIRHFWKVKSQHLFIYHVGALFARRVHALPAVLYTALEPYTYMPYSPWMCTQSSLYVYLATPCLEIYESLLL